MKLHDAIKKTKLSKAKIKKKPWDEKPIFSQKEILALINTQTVEEELKPCPFCGSKAELNKWAVDDYYTISCLNIDCVLWASELEGKTNGKSSLIKLWNTRTGEK